MSDLEPWISKLQGYKENPPENLSLPPEFFSSPVLYDVEQRQIFAKQWVLVCHQDQLAKQGQYVCLDIGSERLALIRAGDEYIALSPICRHRMMPLLEPGSGLINDSTLVCGYHKWSYRLDGSLAAAPYMNGSPGFDRKQCSLPRFYVEVWNGLVFVQAATDQQSDGPTLSKRLAAVSSDIRNYDLGSMVSVYDWKETWNCNWKIAVENGYENYHAIGFHGDTIFPLMDGHLAMEVFEDDDLVTRLISKTAQPFAPEVLELTERQKNWFYSFRVFPCSSVAIFGESVAWISLIPVAVDKTEVRGGMLFPRQTVEQRGLQSLRDETRGMTDVINAEDRSGLQKVQRSLTSRNLERGSLSMHEPGLIAFYKGLHAGLSS